MNIQNKDQWKKAFIQTCESGKLEEVRHLLCQKTYLDLGWANIHAEGELGFLWACKKGHLEVVQYLLTSNELIAAGHTFANLHADHEIGFRLACEQGHLDIVKYLLTSPELIEAGHTWADVHGYDHCGFRWACMNEQWDVVRWLILDYGLKKTRDIEKNMEKYPQAQEYFRVREERQAIQDVLQRTDEKVIKKAKKL